MNNIAQVRKEIVELMDAAKLAAKLDRRDFDAGRYDGLKMALEAVDRAIARSVGGDPGL